jgi:hypothetical protein
MPTCRYFELRYQCGHIVDAALRDYPTIRSRDRERARAVKQPCLRCELAAYPCRVCGAPACSFRSGTGYACKEHQFIPA